MNNCACAPGEKCEPACETCQRGCAWVPGTGHRSLGDDFCLCVRGRVEIDPRRAREYDIVPRTNSARVAWYRCPVCGGTGRVPVRVVPSPRPEVEPPTILFNGPDGFACAMSQADVEGLVWDVLGHALGAESPRETVARLARNGGAR
jgi:hypothetical protein